MDRRPNRPSAPQPLTVSEANENSPLHRPAVPCSPTTPAACPGLLPENSTKTAGKPHLTRHTTSSCDLRIRNQKAYLATELLRKRAFLVAREYPAPFVSAIPPRNLSRHHHHHHHHHRQTSSPWPVFSLRLQIAPRTSTLHKPKDWGNLCNLPFSYSNLDSLDLNTAHGRRPATFRISIAGTLAAGNNDCRPPR